MNKKLLAAAVGVALAAPAFAQSSNVTMYGRIHTAFDSTKNDAPGSRTQNGLVNEASRLGVRGVEDLGGGLKALFGLETAFNSDNGASGLGNTLRNAYIGLDFGAGGKLYAGRLDSAGGVAPTYSQVGEVINYINHDTGSAQISATRSSGTGDTIFAEHRRSNAFGYTITPLTGLRLDARVALSQTADAANTSTAFGAIPAATAPASNAGAGEADTKNYELAGTYKWNALVVGGAYDKQTFKDRTVQNAGATSFDNRYQLVAGYDFGVAKIGGLFARERFNDVPVGNTNRNEYALSGQVPFGAHKIIATYAQRQLLDTATVTGAKRKQYQVGYNYDFSKRTMGYALYNVIDPNTQAGNDKQKSVVVGLRHNF